MYQRNKISSQIIREGLTVVTLTEVSQNALVNIAGIISELSHSFPHHSFPVGRARINLSISIPSHELRRHEPPPLSQGTNVHSSMSIMASVSITYHIRTKYGICSLASDWFKDSCGGAWTLNEAKKEVC